MRNIPWVIFMRVWQRKLKYRLGLYNKRKSHRMPFRVRRKGHKGRSREAGVLKAVSIFMIFIILGKYIMHDIELRINPLISDMALSNLNSIVIRESNAALNETLSEYNLSYDSFVEKTTNSSGEIDSLSLNYENLNLMKSYLSINIQNRIDDVNYVDVNVPIMAFFSDRFFSGRGIPISLKILTDENLDVEFCDEFISEGINQTKHLIKVKVITDFGISFPIRKSELPVEIEIPIAETVLVGDVPETYINFN